MIRVCDLIKFRLWDEIQRKEGKKGMVITVLPETSDGLIWMDNANIKNDEGNA